MTARPTDGLLSHEDAANYLDTPPATLHQWNCRGKGPKSYKIGRARKYRRADLDAFIEAHAMPGLPDYAAEVAKATGKRARPSRASSAVA